MNLVEGCCSHQIRSLRASERHRSLLASPILIHFSAAFTSTRHGVPSSTISQRHQSTAATRPSPTPAPTHCPPQIRQLQAAPHCNSTTARTSRRCASDGGHEEDEYQGADSNTVRPRLHSLDPAQCSALSTRHLPHFERTLDLEQTSGVDLQSSLASAHSDAPPGRCWVRKERASIRPEAATHLWCAQRALLPSRDPCTNPTLNGCHSRIWMSTGGVP